MPYALTISKSTVNMVNAGSPLWMREPSAMAIMKKPMNMYQRSKDNCRRKWAPTYEGSLSSSFSSVAEP